MRSLLKGSSTRERHLAVAAALGEETVEKGLLLIAPSRGAADDFLLEHCRGRGAFGVEKRTLFHLALELAAPVLGAAAPVSALGVEAVAALVTTDALEAKALSSLEGVARMPGFARALRSSLGDLRAAGVAPEQLETGERTELGYLLAAFEKELDAWGLADDSLVFRVAAEALAKGEHRWLGWPCLLLDPELYSHDEADFLRALLEPMGSVTVCLGRGDSETEQRLVDLFGPELDRIDLDAGAEDPPTTLARAQRRLFRPDADEEEEPQPDESVVVFSAAAEGQECVEIARRLRDLARDGLRFDRLAVVVRDASNYMPLLEDALQRAGIPAYFSHGTSRPDPAGRAFLALLACATDNLSASRFAEYLSLAQVPRDERGRPPEEPEVVWQAPEQFALFGVDPALGDGVVRQETDVEQEVPRTSVPVPARWERILVDAAVVGGRERWRRRLAGRQAELKLQARQIGDDERPRRTAIDYELQQLQALESFALPLIERLDDLPDSGTWGEWLGILEELAAVSLDRPETVLKLLAELRPMRDVGPVQLPQVQQVLTERLSVLRREPPKRRYGKVFVGLLEELAGRRFDTVFLPGLSEGVFPRRAFEDPLLPDSVRRGLSSALRLQRHRVARERLLLHRAVESADRTIVASYPRVDAARGRASVPSFYALDLLRAAEGGLPDLGTIARRAAAASSSAVGWAVPQRCEEAIDEAEFDLALLRPLLLAESGGKGQGRFLLLSNEHLGRSLRSRARRWLRRFSSADGLVVERDSPALEVLAKHHPRGRSFSPTALQHFSQCPYRFFLQAVQRLRPRDQIDRLEELDPLTRGSLFHEIQYEFLSRLRDAGELPVTVDNQAVAHDLLDEIFEELVPRFAEELAPAIDRVWSAEMDGLRNDLRGWLSQVAQSGARWTPRHFELAFGLAKADSKDPSSVEEPVGVMAGIQLRGAIDLVEIDRAGSRLRVTDHKTGKAPALQRLTVGKGEILQPVLYALAAESLLGDDELKVASGRLFYCTQRGGYEELTVDLDPASRSAAEKVLDTVAESLEEGFLPALPRKDACKWCDYRSLCGPYEELRALSKDWRQPLPRRLAEVRRLD
ncbi:MAG: PD-(D/E)XK nuclease family protein [Acidobacteriota bacterium]